MSPDRPHDFLVSLVHELRGLPRETEWVEFKVNLALPQEIGEYISALANSAALVGKASGYLVWGVSDGDHELVGTTFSPRSAKVGNEELENWLLHSLDPKIHFQFFETDVDGVPVVILEIERAFRHPVRFQGDEFVRVGSYKKRLKDHPERERELWRIFDQTPFEQLAAKERATAEEVLDMLDYPAYFDLLSRPLPASRQGILQALAEDDLTRPCDAGGWDITNLGAVLFAKKLERFRPLGRKAVRVIQYRGTSRIETIREQTGGKGYASGFDGLISYINGLLPTNEVIGQALRKTVPMFPEPAVRELVANALIHQDFFVTGAAPMVEIFEDRLEITNPGAPLVDAQRFVDTPPKSRNEALVSLMRRTGICEERGSGWDKVVGQTEFYQLPAPLIEAGEWYTRVILFASRPLTKMTKPDRIRAVYLHACLRYVNQEHTTNASVRKRFGIESQNIAAASRLIKEAVDADRIVPYDPAAAPRLMRYVPVWAAPDPDEFT